MRINIVFVLMMLVSPALADQVQARCDIYPKGSDHASGSMPCIFSQTQGHIVITREDGVTHDLTPEGDVIGNFRDGRGQRVYRNSGLGTDGVIFRTPTESLFIYWDATGGHDPSQPFSTDDYDATADLRCYAAKGAALSWCPAAAARMEDGQATITLMTLAGKQTSLNFMKDATTGAPYVNSPEGEVQAVQEGDSWIVTMDGAIYEVPEVLIVGD